MLSLKEQITEWQEGYIDRCTREEAAEENANLELVLFAIDTLVDQVTNGDNKVGLPSVKMLPERYQDRFKYDGLPINGDK